MIMVTLYNTAAGISKNNNKKKDAKICKDVKFKISHLANPGYLLPRMTGTNTPAVF